MAFWSLGKLRTKMLFWTIGCPMLFGLHDLNEDDFGSINWKGMYGYTIFYSRTDCSFKFFLHGEGSPKVKGLWPGTPDLARHCLMHWPLYLSPKRFRGPQDAPLRITTSTLALCSHLAYDKTPVHWLDQSTMLCSFFPPTCKFT